MTRKRRRQDVPLADRARELHDELGREVPRVSRFSDEEDAEAAVEAGVRQAGDSDRPAGTHAAPEYPLDEPRSEIDADHIVDSEPDDDDDPDAEEPTAVPRGE